MIQATPQVAGLVDIPAAGHNNPPLNEVLTDQYKGLVEDLTAWQASARRAPDRIGNDEQQAGIGKIVVALAKIRGRAEVAHRAEKAPFLEQSRVVDTFFLAGIVKVCTELERGLTVRQTAYATAKVNAERARARASEEQERREAEDRLCAAQWAEDHGDIDGASQALADAARAETAADAAAQVSGAKPSEIAKVSSGGVTVSARQEWTFEIEDYAKIDLNLIRSTLARVEVEKAIRAAVRLGTRDLAGVKIYEISKATNRG